MQLTTQNKVVPKLRFGEFSNSWDISKFDTYCNFQQGVQVDVELHKEKYEDGYIKFLRIENYTQKSNDFRFIPDLYKESKRIDEDDIVVVRYGATAGYIGRGFTGILANNLFKIIPDKNIFNKDYLYQYLISFRVFKFFQTEMAGGAMPALSFGIVKHLKVPITSISEQQKIALFLSAVDEKLRQLTKKKDLLEEYKKGVMQKIFSQELRFKDDNGNNYPDWEEKKLGDVLFEHKLKSTGNEEVYSVSVHKGLINQIEHLGRSFSAKNTDHYNLVKPNDIVYTKSPTGQFPYGIIKQAKINRDVIVSPLYAVFTPDSEHLGYMFDIYFESKHNVHNYLHSIIQKGAKNTINITNSTFLSKSFRLPINLNEQRKIGDFLKSIDSKIKLLSTQIENTKAFKKGLLQQMFV